MSVRWRRVSPVEAAKWVASTVARIIKATETNTVWAEGCKAIADTADGAGGDRDRARRGVEAAGAAIESTVAFAAQEKAALVPVVAQ